MIIPPPPPPPPPSSSQFPPSPPPTTTTTTTTSQFPPPPPPPNSASYSLDSSASPTKSNFRSTSSREKEKWQQPRSFTNQEETGEKRSNLKDGSLEGYAQKYSQKLPRASMKTSTSINTSMKSDSIDNITDVLISSLSARRAFKRRDTRGKGLQGHHDTLRARRDDFYVPRERAYPSLEREDQRRDDGEALQDAIKTNIKKGLSSRCSCHRTLLLSLPPPTSQPGLRRRPTTSFHLPLSFRGARGRRPGIRGGYNKRGKGFFVRAFVPMRVRSNGERIGAGEDLGGD
ncbi:protein enabled homolog [Macrobrachium nipponense]|uniref:protein enabled homolog n=1 Tax=Macrobrachium nipponense TaxID=159736 RepID=UPI0030C83BEF